jgi:hypothetical protein
VLNAGRAGLLYAEGAPNWSGLVPTPPIGAIANKLLAALGLTRAE